MQIGNVRVVLFASIVLKLDIWAEIVLNLEWSYLSANIVGKRDIVRINVKFWFCNSTIWKKWGKGMDCLILAVWIVENKDMLIAKKICRLGIIFMNNTIEKAIFILKIYITSEISFLNPPLFYFKSRKLLYLSFWDYKL
jgi:hypothetical protein